MKRTIPVLLAILFMRQLSFAQPEKKDLMIAGNLSANYTDSHVDKIRMGEQGGVDINPMLGVCVGKGYVFGGGVRYGNMFITTRDAAGNLATRAAIHNVGVYAFSRDFRRIADKFYTRAGTNLGYTINFNRTRDFINDKTPSFELTHTFSILFRMALVYFPKPELGIEFSYGEIGYNLTMQHIVSGSPRSVTNNFVLKYGVDGIQVGIIWLLKPKKKTAEEKK